jgi:hypothetical protein
MECFSQAVSWSQFTECALADNPLKAPNETMLVESRQLAEKLCALRKYVAGKYAAEGRDATVIYATLNTVSRPVLSLPIAGLRFTLARSLADGQPLPSFLSRRDGAWESRFAFAGCDGASK